MTRPIGPEHAGVKALLSVLKDVLPHETKVKVAETLVQEQGIRSRAIPYLIMGMGLDPDTMTGAEPDQEQDNGQQINNPVLDALRKSKASGVEKAIGRKVRELSLKEQQRFVDTIHSSKPEQWAQMWPESDVVRTVSHPGGDEKVVIMNTFRLLYEDQEVDFGFVVGGQAVKHGSGLLIRDDRNDLALYVKGEREGMPEGTKFYTKAMFYTKVENKAVRGWCRIGGGAGSWYGVFRNNKLERISKAEYDAMMDSEEDHEF